MERAYMPHGRSSERARERVKLFAFCVLMLCAGVGLATFAGLPRWPANLPRLEQVVAVLSGSTLPRDAVVLVLVDLAWLVWVWIMASLGLELLIAAAETVARGAMWVASLRRIADRLTIPLVRRAVAAAFAVQVLSRGVPLAAAAPLSETEIALVAPAAPQLVPAATQVSTHTFTALDNAAGYGPTYLVRPGDTLWSIADQAWGSGSAYRRLVDANLGRRMADGQVFTAQGVIQPGWELVVPESEPSIEVVDGQRWYTIQKGDTLSAIASTILGDQNRWRELFELNRGTLSPDGAHVLSNPNVIWPGLRLRLPPVARPELDAPEALQPEDAVPSELIAASATPTVATPALADLSGQPIDTLVAALPPIEADPPPLLRTAHALDPVALEPADLAVTVGDVEAPPAAEDATLPTTPGPGEVPTTSLALGGLGVAALAGAAFGARRLRSLRRLPRERESEVVVEGGFAEAQLAHDFTQALHGVGFDPLAAIIGRLTQFLDEYNLGNVSLVSVRHGRSGTTLTLAAGLAEQPLLVDLAPVFAERLAAEAEAWVSADQDVVVRLSIPRQTRLLPASESATAETPRLVPLGVLYDRQTFSATWSSLGHVLIASLPGHGADTILTSLVAALTARNSPEQMHMWMLAQPRALSAPVFTMPHVVHSVDPTDKDALAHTVEMLHAELDRRTLAKPEADLVVVVPELAGLADADAQAPELELLIDRAASLGVRFIGATSRPEEALLGPLVTHFGTRMVLRMHDEETSVALLGVADAAFLGGGGRLLLRLDGREPVELYGYQVAPEHLERLARLMRSGYPTASRTAESSCDEAPLEPPVAEPAEPLSVQQPSAQPVAVPAVPPPDPVAHNDDQARVTEQTAVTGGPPIEVMCFGGPRVLCAGRQVWPRMSASDFKPWELLLYLACQPPEGVSSQDAVEALWPEDDDVKPGPRFRQLRYRLRQLLADVPGAPESDGICLEHGTLRLDPDVVHSDATEFLGLVRSARINPGPDVTSQLERARALYMGDLLEGPDARRYAWVDERDPGGVTLREHFRKLFQQASSKLAELYASCGALAPAVHVYRELTEIDPGDERLWRALFRLHAELGDRPALVREEHRMREALRDLAADFDDSADGQLDEPSRETAQEYQRLLASLRTAEPDPEPAAV
jgi:nucleoid-associated protein YgaU/DNA-binding SARP family transcriptional activator